MKQKKTYQKPSMKMTEISESKMIMSSEAGPAAVGAGKEE